MNRDSLLPPLAGSPRKPLDIGGFVFRYGALIVLLGGGLVILLAPFAWVLSKPYYEAEGRIRIIRVVAPMLSQYERVSITNYFNDYAKTQVETLLSPHIIENALKALPEKLQAVYRPQGLPAQRAVELLRKRLAVYHNSGTHLLTLRMTGESPDGLAEFLNSLMRVYIDASFQDGQRTEEARLRYLQREKSALDKKAAALSEELRTLALQARTSTFSEEYNIESQKLESLQQSYIQAYAELIRKKNAYREMEEEVRKVKELPIQSLADELVAKDESLWEVSSWTYKQLQELRASIDGTTQKNPDRRYIEDRMEAMTDYETNLKESVSERAMRIVLEKRDYDLDQRLIKAEHDYKAAKKTEENIRLELLEAEKILAANAQDIMRGQDLVAQLEHMRKEMFTFDSKIAEIKAEAQSPMRVSILSPARAPLSPAGDSRKKLLFMCVALAFGGVGGLCALFEFTDNRIRSPKDLEKAVGGPISWPVSEYTGKGEFARLSLDDPVHPAGKALRSLCVKLNRERLERTAKTFLFTGVNNRVGVTSLMVNTAHIMTGVCPRILVVGAGVHHSGQQGSQGLREILTGDTPHNGVMELHEGACELKDCVLRDRERNLDALFLEQEQWTRLSGRRLAELLERFKQEYDAVLIDAPPVLQSDLTEYLALHADVVVLIAQGDASQYKGVRFVAELLVRLQVPAVATVLNWGGEKTLNYFEKFIQKNRLLRKLVLQPSRAPRPPGGPGEL